VSDLVLLARVAKRLGRRGGGTGGEDD